MQVPDSLYPLIQKYLAGSASAAEEKIVNDWYHSFSETIVEVDAPEGIDESMIAGRIKEKLLQHIPGVVTVQPFNRWWLRGAAAAILLLSLCTFLFLSGKKSVGVVTATKQLPTIKSDITPGGNRATLTLADGSVITLDSTANGVLGQQGNTKIIKLNSGQLAYNPGANNQVAKVVLYNTIATPRGGQYQVTLPDETKVWLNASSSIRFPTAFTGNERNVEISGEAYFEVAKNAVMPFNVSVKGAIIHVLGTHFNIMAYDDETSVNTTLLEGSLKIAKGSETRLLVPGQQAMLAKNGIIKIVPDADTEEAVAWKNGRFQFNSADIKTIMRQIERWYDVEIIFNGNGAIHFSGQITRSANVSEVFKKLALTNEINFKIEGRKIIVNQ